MGLSLGMGQAWAQAQAGWPGLTGTASFDPVREKKFPGIFFLGEGPGQNPWPWSLRDLRFLVFGSIYEDIPWEFSHWYRVQQACTSEKKNPWEFFFWAQGPGPGPGLAC